MGGGGGGIGVGVGGGGGDCFLSDTVSDLSLVTSLLVSPVG